MSRRVIHLLKYTDRGMRRETACRAPIPKDPRGLTGTHAKVTCAKCREYVTKTSDGPEMLKSLLRF